MEPGQSPPTVLDLKYLQAKHADRPSAQCSFQHSNPAYNVSSSPASTHHNVASSTTSTYHPASSSSSLGYNVPSSQYAAQYVPSSAQYAAPVGQHAASIGQYAVPSGQYAAPSEQYAAPAPQYAASSGSYVAPPGHYGARQFASAPHITPEGGAGYALPPTPKGWGIVPGAALEQVRETKNIPSYFPSYLSAPDLKEFPEPPTTDEPEASDAAYWKKNAIHKGEMNKALVRMEEEREARITSLEAQARELHSYCGQLQREVRYQQLRSSQAMAAPEHISLEINSLREQLDALGQIRDTLFQENGALQAKLDNQAKVSCQEASMGSCVVCCDNLADVVILPCKHLCVCHECSQLGHKSCPICRGQLHELLRVFPS